MTLMVVLLVVLPPAHGASPLPGLRLPFGSHGCGSLLVLWWRWLLLMVAPALLVMASSVAMAAVENSIIEAAYLAMMVASSFTCW